MWEFLRTALETHGLSAVVLLAVIGGAAFALRELWKKNQSLGVECREALQSEGEKRRLMRDAHDKEILSLRKELQDKSDGFAARLDELHQECREETRELYEKRTKETRDMVREMQAFANDMQRTAATTAEVLSFMKETISRRDV